MLKATNVSWTPPDAGGPVLDDTAIELNAGEALVLYGPSGSGKSTLLRSLVGLQDRGGGHIYWHGQKIDATNMREFRRRVVYVHQEPVGVEDTVGDNLRFARAMADYHREEGPKPLDESAQRKCMETFRLTDIPDERPFDDLSVGERQRLALVRALTLQPDVLLLDEPTASVGESDSRLIENHLFDYLHQRPERRALVWVSHDREQRERLSSDSACRTLDLQKAQ